MVMNKRNNMEEGPRSPTRPFGYAEYIRSTSSDSVKEKRGMSTTACAQDGGALREAIANVRSDTAGLDRKSWVLVGHVNNEPSLIDVIDQDCSPEADVSDFCSKLQDDQVMYGLIRLTSTVDMSSTIRFVYVHWIGDNVPFVKKGRLGVVHGSVEEHFRPYHILVATGNQEELSLEELLKRVEDNAMTSSKVLEGDALKDRQERGFTQHAVRKQATGQLRSVAPDGATIEVTPELEEALAEVRNDKSNVTWVLAGYEDGNLKKALTCLAQGEGDIEEMKSNLQEDLVMYGLYRTSDEYDNIKTVKFVYVYCIGEKVKPLTKGKVSAYAGPAEKIFSPAHVSLSISSKYELDEDVVNDKVKSSSGSKSWIK